MSDFDTLGAINRFRARKGLRPKTRTDLYWDDVALIIDELVRLDARVEKLEADQHDEGTGQR